MSLAGSSSRHGASGSADLLRARGKIVLVGLMGAGKTTVGARLAERLGQAFADSDVEIEASSGQTISQIFATQGEERFRRLEEEAVARLLSKSEPMVLALGGGAVTSESTRRLLGERSVVVWLSADPERLASRLGEKAASTRPLLRGGADSSLRRLSEERSSLYDSVADLVVDTTDCAPREVVEVLLTALGHGSCGEASGSEAPGSKLPSSQEHVGGSFGQEVDRS